MVSVQIYLSSDSDESIQRLTEARASVSTVVSSNITSSNTSSSKRIKIFESINSEVFRPHAFDFDWNQQEEYGSILIVDSNDIDCITINA